MLYPITFSIASEKIIDYIPIKKKIISSLIPGNQRTYIYETEEEYYEEYRTSWFATTTKKGGWDCLRHYEILANGCIPYFPNFEKCPINTMALFPKDLILFGNQLYKRFTKPEGPSEEDIKDYNGLCKKLLEYMKNNLTTEKIAEYILKKSSLCEAKKILFLSSKLDPDYLRCLTLHGFKVLFGTECHDYPKIPHIYKCKDINYKNLYGKGMTYTNLLDSSLHNDSYDLLIEEKIKEKYFDCVIYGTCHRSMPYFDLVNNIYKPNEIILLCGEDENRCKCKSHSQQLINKGYTLFIREL